MPEGGKLEPVESATKPVEDAIDPVESAIEPSRRPLGTTSRVPLEPMNCQPSYRASSPRLERESTRHLARALGMPFVDLAAYPISCGILRRVPAELCCRLRCVPLVDNPTRTVLAIDDAWSAPYLSVNCHWFGHPRRRVLEFALSTPEALDVALHRRLTLVRD